MELSIVVPTYNERGNVAELLNLLQKSLAGIQWELVVVDDNSPDHTAEFVRQMAQSDSRVRCVHRYGRRGLSSACVEGIMSTSSPFVAVMDGDLQHDETRLPLMLQTMREQDVDIVVGSRNIAGGGMGEFSEQRQLMSRFASRLAFLATRTRLSDPMSGFFMIRRSAFMQSLPNLSAIGFKILLDLFASSPNPLTFREVPYQFRTRQVGESKLDSLVLWEYLLLLLDKTLGKYVPVRFLSFAIIGGSGVLVHFAVLTTLFKGLGVAFATAQGAATFVAITTNFLLNNLLTYSDRRLRGSRLLFGWITFNLVCAAGAVANVGISNWLFENRTMWVISALAGIGVGVVWNYAASSIFTWRGNSRPKAA